MLNFTDVSLRRGPRLLIEQVNMIIHQGQHVGIPGANGSGKSTTLGIILNVVNRTSGDFTWFDGKISTHEALKRVGAIIERPNFYPYMSAIENLKLVCKIKEIPYDKIEQKLKQVQLYERRNSKFKTYSLGMKQRLAIASALLNDPEILILDEPTNGLDPQGIHEIRSIIQEIASNGTTILLASHLLDEVEKVCSHVVVIREGIKLYSGRVDEMTASHGIIEIESKSDKKDIFTALKSMEGIESVQEEGERIFIRLNQEVSSGHFNRQLMEQGIELSHLVKRRPTLEQQFLSLTNNNQPPRKTNLL